MNISRFSSHREIEDQDVSVIPHRLVEVNDEYHEEVPNTSDDDDQGEEDGHDVWDWRWEVRDINFIGETIEKFQVFEKTLIWKVFHIS